MASNLLSHAHISQTSEDLLLSLVFLDVFAEGAVTRLHVGELVLVLNEELVALLALRYGHIRHHVLEVPLRVAWAVV